MLPGWGDRWPLPHWDERPSPWAPRKIGKSRRIRREIRRTLRGDHDMRETGSSGRPNSREPLASTAETASSGPARRGCRRSPRRTGPRNATAGWPHTATEEMFRVSSRRDAIPSTRRPLGSAAARAHPRQSRCSAEQTPGPAECRDLPRTNGRRPTKACSRRREEGLDRPIDRGPSRQDGRTRASPRVACARRCRRPPLRR
jgi:hypothetical protein